MTSSPFLITPEALATKLDKPRLSVVDASWYLPVQGRNAKAEYAAAHIPGAVFFDQDRIVDPASDLPHTLPSAALFSELAGALGISDSDTIVVYDGLGLFAAPRVWWMFRTFGARDVLILDGGFPAWSSAGLPTESGAAVPPATRFDATFHAQAVVGFAEMRDVVARGALQIADARPADRFEGAVPEPRPGVRPGHMPGALSLPFPQLVRDGRLKSPDELRAAFAAADVDPAVPVVTTCGSGVTAAILNLALETLGNTASKLYDGSWTEWGSAPDTAVATGSPGRPTSRRD